MASGSVIAYNGKRGTVWRIKYRDATGKQVMETVGAERDGFTRKQAEAELRERVVRVERKGYRRPRALTFGQYAETWFEAGKRSQGWKPATVQKYRSALTSTSSRGSARRGSRQSGRGTCRRLSRTR